MATALDFAKTVVDPNLYGAPFHTQNALPGGGVVNPEAPVMPAPAPQPGNTTDPLTGDTSGAGAVYDWLFGELSKPDAPDDSQVADFGQKFGTGWLTNYKNEFLNKIIPSLAGYNVQGRDIGAGDYTRILGDLQQRGIAPWQYLQLMSTAATQLGQTDAGGADPYTSSYLYDRGDDPASARLMSLAGFGAGAPNPTAFPYASRSAVEHGVIPQYWVR